MRRGARTALALGLALAAVAAPAWAATNEISTVAGNGSAGFSGDGGPASQAQLNFPRGVAALPGGGFLIADRANDRVRSVAADGTISTVAGTGVAGFSGNGGPATAARIDFIHDVAPTSDGGFLIADTRNQRIRYVSAAGVISTIAGSGPFGCFCSGGFAGDGGQATSARLNNPHGVAPTTDGGFLIADTDNNRIRRVAPNGVITTVAGSGPAGYYNGGFGGDGGPATSARLKRPFAVAPLPTGGFLIADTGNRRIRRVSASGKITTIAGTGAGGFGGDGGPAKAAVVGAPHDVVMIPGIAYLFAAGNHRVRKVSLPSTVITTVAGTGVAGYNGDGIAATAADLNQPEGLAVTAEGDFLIADEGNHRIRLVDADLVP